MKILITLALALFVETAVAFTLTSSDFFRFNNEEEIIVDVAQDGCSASGGYSAQELLDMAENGAELYWNTVETANIRLKAGSILAVNANGQTLDQFYGSIFSYRNHIVIGCSSTVPSTAAAHATSRGSDRNMVGIVLYKDSAGNFGRSYNTTSAILAHEMGHALGLGHTTYANALMEGGGGALGLYKLSQDDRSGITYLYPHDKKAGGCLGSIGSIYDINDDNHFGGPFSFALGFLLMILIFRHRARFAL